MSKQYDFGLEITGIKEDKFIPEYKNARLNVCDVDSELFQRTPEDNDRPELEKYYSRLPKDENGNSELVWFCGFVIPYENNKTRSVIVNVINEFGELMAAHVIVHDEFIKPYRGKLIEFRGRIYKYRAQYKFGIQVIEESVYEIETKENDTISSKWNSLGFDYDLLKVQEIINYYIREDDYLHLSMLRQSERLLDILSERMFGISGLIYPAILNMFLMKDDVASDLKLVHQFHKHVNIICTICIDYLIWLKPKSYLEMLRILTYIVINYLGGNVDDPGSCKASSYLQESVDELGIKNDHVKYHLNNIIKDCGGMKAISDTMNNYDEIYKLTPEKVAEYARRDFAQRVLIRIPDNKLKYYVHLNRLK